MIHHLLVWKPGTWNPTLYASIRFQSKKALSAKLPWQGCINPRRFGSGRLSHSRSRTGRGAEISGAVTEDVPRRACLVSTISDAPESLWGEHPIATIIR